MATIRELFPFGDLDESVVAAVGERFPAIPSPELAAGFELGKAMVGALDTMATMLAGYGLSPARWRLLVALAVQAGADGATIGELAGHLGVKDPTITATVDRLEAEGLVTRERDEDDRRMVRVVPTESGMAMVGRLIPEIASRLTRFVESLGGPDAVRDTAARIAAARTRLED